MSITFQQQSAGIFFLKIENFPKMKSRWRCKIFFFFRGFHPEMNKPKAA